MTGARPRREPVDDLLTGGSRGPQLLEHAPAFGLRLEALHTVLDVALRAAQVLDWPRTPLPPLVER